MAGLDAIEEAANEIFVEAWRFFVLVVLVSAYVYEGRRYSRSKTRVTGKGGLGGDTKCYKAFCETKLLRIFSRIQITMQQRQRTWTMCRIA